jgi:hypothetical protein
MTHRRLCTTLSRRQLQHHQTTRPLEIRLGPTLSTSPIAHVSTHPFDACCLALVLPSLPYPRCGMPTFQVFPNFQVSPAVTNGERLPRREGEASFTGTERLLEGTYYQICPVAIR